MMIGAWKKNYEKSVGLDREENFGWPSVTTSTSTTISGSVEGYACSSYFPTVSGCPLGIEVVAWVYKVICMVNDGPRIWLSGTF